MQPHGYCFLWRSEILAAYVVGNGITAISYFAIPIMFFVLLSQEKTVNAIPVPRILLIYALFILFCGIGHVFMIYNVFFAQYRLEAYWNLATGFVSMIAAVASYSVIKQLFRIYASGSLHN